MDKNSRFRISNWSVRSSVVVAAALLWLATVCQAQTVVVSMEVTDGRPVAETIRTLTKKYPTVVTYEDPRYEYPGDIKDVTEEVRSRLSGPAGASTKRILVPGGGTLRFSYEANVDANGRPANVRETLEAVLTANMNSAFPGRFRIEQTGEVFHVIPTQVRNQRGDWVAQASVLDARITLPRREMNGYEMLVAITEAVSDATGIHVGLTSGDANSFFNHSGYLQADNEVARSVLLRTLYAINNRFTWSLLYGPDVKWYALNISAVAPTERAPFAPPPIDPDQPPIFRQR